MIKCKCGRWTNHGLTCSNCRGSNYYPKEDDYNDDELEEEVEMSDGFTIEDEWTEDEED